MESDLRHLVQDIRGKLETCGKLASSIRDVDLQVQSKTFQMGEIHRMVDAAKRRLQSYHTKHIELKDRFDRGSMLLSEFSSWLCDSYGWMEKTLIEKRSSLEKEIPAEQTRLRALFL
eukprot:TRINITY_DN31052_c0_g1_i1.p2 TRINITY_DN31052_c0_g1~~TRINITY_DN31052_c0_g1_i1.p2  ORF type:complete len:117 (-),score=20.48 TRINITY_DN31052_c0_g1_i1:703-1053(-)